MRRKSLAAVILAFTGLIGSMIWSFLPSPLPPPTPWSAALPVASPPPSMAIFQLPHRNVSDSRSTRVPWRLIF
jgi:hypothetical protein